MPAAFTTLAGWHDVFHEILIHLEPVDDYEKDLDSDLAAIQSFRRTLLSLALSSHALSNPSLDKLWGSLASITPLLELLPSYRSLEGTYVSDLGHALNSLTHGISLWTEHQRRYFA